MKSLLVVALAAMTVLSGCGKRGRPLAPVKVRPTPIENLRLAQVGEQIVVRGEIPAMAVGVVDGPGIVEVRVMRMPGSDQLRPDFVSTRYLLRQFEKHSVVVVSLEGERLATTAPGGRLRVADPTPVTVAVGGGERRWFYSVMVVDSKGKNSLLAIPVEIPVIDPLPIPMGLLAEPAEGEVRLSWSLSDKPEDRPLYNIYRRIVSDPPHPEDPLNPSPISAIGFIDTTFRYGETYIYVVRAIGGEGLPLRESADSAGVRLQPLDVYPPATPEGLAVTVEGRVIKVYWFPNSEPDLGGYRIFRRRERNGPFEMIGVAGPTETSYVDTTVLPGVRYDYTMSALDSVTPPNESGRPEARGDSLPPDSETFREPGAPDEPDASDVPEPDTERRR